MTIITIPAISTFLSAERGVGAGWVVFLRGAAVLVVTGLFEREAWGLFFLARLGVLFVVPDFFLLPVLFWFYSLLYSAPLRYDSLSFALRIIACEL